MNLDDQNELRETERGRRYLLCTRIAGICDTIERIPMDDKQRQELKNLANVLLRMSLQHNDGGTSPHTVPGF